MHSIINCFSIQMPAQKLRGQSFSICGFMLQQLKDLNHALLFFLTFLNDVDMTQAPTPPSPAPFIYPSAFH